MTTPTREALLDTIRQLADRAIPVVAQRNAAYAGGGDVFGNLNLIETLSSGDIRTETGIVIRMGDKVSRLYSLTARNAPENDESLEDTLVDLLGYSALLLLRHRTRKSSPPIIPKEPPKGPIEQPLPSFTANSAFANEAAEAAIHKEVQKLNADILLKRPRTTIPGTIGDEVQKKIARLLDPEPSPPIQAEVNPRSGIMNLQDKVEKPFKIETQNLSISPAAQTPTAPTTVRKHSYAWDGTIPCTGSYRCFWCKKVADATGTDYSKVDYNEPCPGSPA